MNYTVENFMEVTGEKRGNIESFRKMLRARNVLGANESLNDNHLEMFKKVKAYKEANMLTWAEAFDAVISDTLLFSKTKIDFDTTIILKDLLWRINNGFIFVRKPSDNLNDEDFHDIYEVIIDNFTYQDAGTFKNSRGTDGNPITTFICEDQHKQFIYYLVGKYSHVFNREEMHVFYNDAPYFNVMKLKYVDGGDADTGIYNELFKICRQKT